MHSSRKCTDNFSVGIWRLYTALSHLLLSTAPDQLLRTKALSRPPSTNPRPDTLSTHPSTLPVHRVPVHTLIHKPPYPHPLPTKHPVHTPCPHLVVHVFPYPHTLSMPHVHKPPSTPSPCRGACWDIPHEQNVRHL